MLAEVAGLGGLGASPCIEQRTQSGALLQHNLPGSLRVAATAASAFRSPTSTASTTSSATSPGSLFVSSSGWPLGQLPLKLLLHLYLQIFLRNR